MTTHSKYHGHWHAPDGSVTTHGYLEILPQSLKLNMIGIRDAAAASHETQPTSVSSRRKFFSDAPDTIPVLCAQSAEGAAVSLFDLQFRHSHGDPFGMGREGGFFEYHPRLALIGGRHVEDLGTERFATVTLTFQHFSNWPPGSPFQYEFRDDEPHRQYLMLDWKPPVTEVRVESARLTLRFRTYFTSKPEGGRETYDRHGSVTLVPDEPQTMENLLSVVGQVHTLLNFLFGQRLQTKRLSVSTPRVAQVLRDGTAMHESFELVTNRGRQADLVDDRVTPVFPFEAMGGQAADVFSAWLTAEPQLRRAVNGFVMVAFNRELLLDSKYTDLAGILESLAREGGTQTYLDAKVFEQHAREIRKSIPKDFPEALRQILAVRIKTANEYSLQSKAQGLIEVCWPILEGRVSLSPAEFAEAAANNRNALVHNSEGKKRLLVRDGEALYYMTEAITAVAYAAIALRLGIAQDTVLRQIKATFQRSTWRLTPEHFRTGGE